MDTHNQSNQRIDESWSLIRAIGQALVDWTAVPPAIIGRTKPQVKGRTEREQIVVQGARKFCEDVGAAVILLQHGCIGPPHALVRMCRENAVVLAFLAVTDSDTAQRLARFIAVQRPAAAKLRLDRLVNSLIDLKLDLPQAAQLRLGAAVLSPEDHQHAMIDAAQEKEHRGEFTFNQIVRGVAQMLTAEGIPESGALVTSAIDYWIESEVIHNGYDGINAYHVEGKDWRNDLFRLHSILVLLMDLRDLAALVTRATLQTFGVLGELPRPPESVRLTEVGNRVASYLRMTEKSAP